MPEIGGVWYGDTAYEHMRELSSQLTLDATPTIGNEAAVIHAFHEEFPGVIMRDALELDPAAARAATDEAIERVDRAADPEWKDRALDAVHAICLSTDIFTPDHIWQRVEKPREPRALGPVMQPDHRVPEPDRGQVAPVRQVHHSGSADAVTRHLEEVDLTLTHVPLGTQPKTEEPDGSEDA